MSDFRCASNKAAMSCYPPRELQSLLLVKFNLDMKYSVLNTELYGIAIISQGRLHQWCG